MRPSPPVEMARKVLRSPDRKIADYLLASVNLTLLEKEIIVRSEIDGTRLEVISVSLKNWNNPKRDCSYANCVKIKKKGMLKIAKFLKSIDAVQYGYC